MGRILLRERSWRPFEVLEAYTGGWGNPTAISEYGPLAQIIHTLTGGDIARNLPGHHPQERECRSHFPFPGAPSPSPCCQASVVRVNLFKDPVPVYDDAEGTAGRLTAWLTRKKWSRCGQLPDSRTITRRARVITSAATLISRVRHVQAKPPPKGSRSRRLLKNFLRDGSSSARSATRPAGPFQRTWVRVGRPPVATAPAGSTWPRAGRAGRSSPGTGGR